MSSFDLLVRAPFKPQRAAVSPAQQDAAKQHTAAVVPVLQCGNARIKIAPKGSAAVAAHTDVTVLLTRAHAAEECQWYALLGYINDWIPALGQKPGYSSARRTPA